MSWRYIIVALCAACTTLSAQDCDGDIYGGVELLYWKATHCSIPFAVGEKNSNGFTKVREFSIKGDYDWGVRGYLGYERCCYFGELSYLWLETENASRRVHRGDFNDGLDLQSVGETDFAHSRLRFRYQNVDLRFGEYLQKGKGCAFQMYGHLRWADIDMHNRSIGSDQEEAPQSYEQNSSFQGGGIGVGVSGSSCIWRKIGIGSRLSLLGLVGRVRLDKQVKFIRGTGAGKDPQLISLTPSGRTTVVPVGEARLHLHYATTCRCTTVRVELGYELDYYFKALRYSDQDQNSGGLPLRTCFNVGFGGPYLGLRVGF